REREAPPANRVVEGETEVGIGVAYHRVRAAGDELRVRDVRSYREHIPLDVYRNVPPDRAAQIAGRDPVATEGGTEAVRRREGRHGRWKVRHALAASLEGEVRCHRDVIVAHRHTGDAELH